MRERERERVKRLTAMLNLHRSFLVRRLKFANAIALYNHYILSIYHFFSLPKFPMKTAVCFASACFLILLAPTPCIQIVLLFYSHCSCSLLCIALTRQFGLFSFAHRVALPSFLAYSRPLAHSPWSHLRHSRLLANGLNFSLMNATSLQWTQLLSNGLKVTPKDSK